MNKYEVRLLKFLQDNPNVRMTARQIAGVWKRKVVDVNMAMLSLFAQHKINLDFNGTVSLNLCGGIGDS